MLYLSSRECRGLFLLFLGGEAKGELGSICLGSVKEPAERSYFKWRASVNTNLKAVTSFSDLSSSFSHGRKVSLRTIFENKLILLPSIFITNYTSLYSQIFWPVSPPLEVCQNHILQKKIQVLLPYVILMLLELFEKISNFYKENLLKKMSQVSILWKNLRMVLFKNYLPWFSFIALIKVRLCSYLTFRLFLYERKEKGSRSCKN